MHIKVLTLIQKRQYQINADLHQLIKHCHHWSEKEAEKKKKRNQESRILQLETNKRSILLTAFKELWLLANNQHKLLYNWQHRLVHTQTHMHSLYKHQQQDSACPNPSSCCGSFSLGSTIQQDDFRLTRC